METRSVTLGMVLRSHRVDRGLSITELAGRAGMSRPKLSRIEHGHLNPSRQTVRLLAGALGIDESTTARLLDDVEAQIRTVEMPADNAAQHRYVDVEQKAVTLKLLTPEIPALLQTPAYTRALVNKYRASSFADIDLAEFIKTRVLRRHVLYDMRRQFTFILPLRSMTSMGLQGSDQILQLAYLAEGAGLPNVAVHLIEDGAYDKYSVSMSLIDNRWVSIETPDDHLMRNDEAGYERWKNTFERALTDAFDREESLSMLHDALGGYGRTVDLRESPSAVSSETLNSPLLMASTNADHSS